MAGIGGTVVELAAGSVPLMVAGGVSTLVLAIAGRRKDGNPGRRAVFLGTRTLAWTMDGDALVEAFLAAKIIGPREGLMFHARPVRKSDGWSVIVASRLAGRRRR